MNATREQWNRIWTVLCLSSLVIALAANRPTTAIARVISGPAPNPTGDGTPYEEPEEVPDNPPDDRKHDDQGGGGDGGGDGGEEEEGGGDGIIGKQHGDQSVAPMRQILLQLALWLRRN